MSGRLAGRVALVTGATRGIGAGVAATLAVEGAAVGVLGRDVERAAAVVAGIEAAGGRAVALQCDLESEPDIVAAVAALQDACGDVQLIVNDAAMAPSRLGLPGTGETIALDVWRRYFAVNVTAPMLVTRHALPGMRRSGYGAVVNVNSVCGFFPMRGDVAYAASKAALHGLTRSMAIDLGPDVRVNEVVCGYTPVDDNPVHQEMMTDPVRRAALLRNTFTGRVGTPQDVGNACVYLLSPESGYVTGQSLFLDGGSHLPMAVPHMD